MERKRSERERGRKDGSLPHGHFLVHQLPLLSPLLNVSTFFKPPIPTLSTKNFSSRSTHQHRTDETKQRTQGHRVGSHLAPPRLVQATRPSGPQVSRREATLSLLVLSLRSWSVALCHQSLCLHGPLVCIFCNVPSSQWPSLQTCSSRSVLRTKPSCLWPCVLF